MALSTIDETKLADIAHQTKTHSAFCRVTETASGRLSPTRRTAYNGRTWFATPSLRSSAPALMGGRSLIRTMAVKCIDLTPNQITEIIAWSQASRAVLETYLFGSRVKGNAKPDSDIDIAISVETQPGWTNKNSYDQHWLEWVTDLEERIGIRVDLVRLHPENPRTLAAVREVGVLLYRRQI